MLGDERLHEFVGGRPPTVGELRTRFALLEAGAPRTNVVWLNWIVRRRPDSEAVGTVQATVEDGGRKASVAWVIGSKWQKQGFASEAASALVGWLRGQGVGEIVAYIHPEHRASELVASRAGLEPTAEMVDCERVWRLEP